MKTLILACLVAAQLMQCIAEDHVEPDGTVAAQPGAVVPPPIGTQASPNANEVNPAVAPGNLQPIDGTTSQTKHPDGSTTTITHFRGQLPPNAFPHINPYFGYSVLPPYFYPVPPHPGYGFNPNSLPPPGNPPSAARPSYPQSYNNQPQPENAPKR